MRADLEAILPEQFTFTEDRDYADYIYLRSDLSTLKGKKFQAKRNHTNRFRNTYPDYEYTPITPDRIQECLDLEAEWCKVNNCDQQEGTGQRTSRPDLCSPQLRGTRTDGRYLTCER